MPYAERRLAPMQDSEEVRPGDLRRDKSTEKLHDPLAVHLFVVEEDARMGELPPTETLP